MQKLLSFSEPQLIQPYHVNNGLSITADIVGNIQELFHESDYLPFDATVDPKNVTLPKPKHVTQPYKYTPPVYTKPPYEHKQLTNKKSHTTPVDYEKLGDDNIWHNGMGQWITRDEKPLYDNITVRNINRLLIDHIEDPDEISYTDGTMKYSYRDVFEAFEVLEEETQMPIGALNKLTDEETVDAFNAHLESFA
jgi:hypothetical protein